MRLQIAGIVLIFTIASLSLQAEPWEFDKPIAVTSTNGKNIFHHLESAGRHNIAISANTVAIAWEDDRDGTPRIYLARKAHTKQNFSNQLKISGPGEAYEPSLVALSKNRFALAWEEESRIHLRIVTPTELGPVITLGKGEAMQPSLVSDDQQLLLVYSQRDGRYPRIWMQRMEIDGQVLKVKQACAVDAEAAKDEQLYPSVVKLAERIIVAWEDRRPGHTIIMAAQNENLTSCTFQPPQRISEEPLSSGGMPYGKGHGVSRVALAQYGAEQLLAVWADKRDFREGYDIYSADYEGASKDLFGPNFRVQDSFGGVAQQWHATVAGDQSGRLVVGWDDNRNGNADIMLSWREDDEWSDDFSVPGADGAGEQNHPTISLDSEGNLHLAWIERQTADGPTRVLYLFGQLVK
ncbi:MAG: hypothetical protein OQK98_00745 [Gammaproteobacteria bacterium]|nr:hypothetical protein [Gammaproteobacteria bacterium]